MLNMKIFVGVGLGPIQTGIFLSGAAKGEFDRIVIAEVDDKIKDAINSSGGEVTINIAADDHVYSESYDKVEVYNPMVEEERTELIKAASEACELATALPSVKFFGPTAEWMREAFELTPEKQRFIYTAENNNEAAEELEKAVNKAFPNTYYLNTVVGKMSGVTSTEECEKLNLKELCPGAGRGHLVEEFNNILISSCPNIESRQVKNLSAKADLYPFEEAKLFGHNAIHFLLGTLGKQQGKEYMSELRSMTELMEKAEKAFIDECGAALCKKWAGVDELFTSEGFRYYAENLLERMTNPFLQDAIDRITRDLPRKLSWNDRVIGTMRVVIAQDIEPVILREGAVLAIKEEFGNNAEEARKGLRELWSEVPQAEQDSLLDFIFKKFE
jgi:mannitol-1-phosphate 5-dehydrogenase